MKDTQDILFLKTSSERSAVTKARISGKSSRKSQVVPTGRLLYLNLKSGRNQAKSGGAHPHRGTAAVWETITQSPTESMTRNFGEYPKGAAESTLSQILEAGAPEKYNLSAKACTGILRRAKKRGKQLPKELAEALEQQASA
jgi:hypothetical protein